MSEDELRAAERDPSEGIVERLEQAVSPSEKKLARTSVATRELDRTAAFDAWRRWP